MKKIGVITSGGDSPGMNAAIRGVVRTATSHGVEVLGFFSGYSGILNNEFICLESASVGGIISSGGTILRTARSKDFRTLEGRKKSLSVLQSHGVEGLVVIGGDGSLTGAWQIHKEFDFPVLGIPGSIDNDISGTDFSIGFDTAVNTALGAVDKVRDTAYSHDRVFVIEVMGRHNGFIALECGIAAGAEAVLIPEVEFSLSHICKDLHTMRERGKISSIIIVAEGAASGAEVKDYIDRNAALEARCIVLGHMQRGGSPTAFDRVLALSLAAGATERLIKGHGGEMAGFCGGKVIFNSLEYVLKTPRTIDRNKLALVEIMAH